MGEDHTAFCVRSVISKVPNVEVTGVEDFDFSVALESVYPLLEIIFNFLNYNDLQTCCKVKKSWKDIAESILQKRNKSSWFTCYKTKIKPRRNVFKHSDNLHYNNVGMGIILYDSRRIKLNKYICVHSNIMELSRKSVPEYLEEELVPRSIDYCVISCPQVVSYFDASKDTKDIGLGSILDGIFIPKIPGIRTAMFHCNPVRKSNIQKSIEPYINANEEVKCLLLFCTTNPNKSIYNLLEYLIPENCASSVAVGGGIIRGTKTFQQICPAKRIYSSNDTFCIVFLQERYSQPQFNAFSCVIYGDDLSKKEFEEELLKFKKQIILRTDSIAFRICCSAKCDTEEELILFGKVFPNVPLLGLNADGEIGWDCILSTEESDNGESKAKKSKTKIPQSATSMVYYSCVGYLGFSAIGIIFYLNALSS
ncbi:hypothetical protein NQ318_006290 [Aromia moschata]|uniref:F-box domain-containing protein n=1 Tax=Aromia moschata TaxID=1265417 RepID=A0AAV8YW77_9CUCU|nr:hypothetical protein NQ318_006290 [Aromia moschata]